MNINNIIPMKLFKQQKKNEKIEKSEISDTGIKANANSDKNLGVVLDLNSNKNKQVNGLYTYKSSRNLTNSQLVEKLFNYSNKQVNTQLGNMQAYMQGFIDGAGTDSESISNLEQLLLERYGIDTKLDPSSIEEGGFYSAENVSDRLVKFAINISGGDPSKADMLMDAVKKGFELAEQTWGNELPEISQNTYDLTIEKFENWINGEMNQTDVVPEAVSSDESI